GSGSKGAGIAPGHPRGHRPRSAPLAILVHRHLRLADGGRRVQVTLRCPPRSAPCAGIVRLLLAHTRSAHSGRRPRSRSVALTLASAHFGPRRGAFTVSLRLDAAARATLARHRSHHSTLLIQISSGARAKRYSVTGA
ncbi:MAG: hypothetical protein FWD42_09415, partial [Solirubrobacterales bacterium]|nr:hypothetical protein [Solirubrobacterales bacterium]